MEKYEIEPFKITLSSWVIVPHMEALEAELEVIRGLPTQEVLQNRNVSETDAELNALIKEEEEIGKQRSKRRTKVRSKARIIDARDEEKLSPKVTLENQRRMYQEFNGPCVVCLEPDGKSQAILAELRAVLADELFPDCTEFSPSSSVATQRLNRSSCTGFRALVPIGAFSTVSQAVDMARRLKAVWDPLTFLVRDLHLISTGLESAQEEIDDDFSDSREYALKQVTSEEQDLSTKIGQFGCDALVSLLGEEIEQDDEINQEMVNFLVETGEPGGADPMAEGAKCSTYHLESSGDHEDDERTRELFSWLDDDDGYDEGQVVVIGRTSFFSGEARSYVGMPASSVIDGKDRVLGKSMNASSRRRGSGAARTSNLAKNGEFGYQETDYTKGIL